MRNTRLSQTLLAFVALMYAAALSGCGVSASFPSAEAVVAPAETVLPSIQGSNFGGHAPIVNAKVFLLQAGQSGYGSKSTSLLTAAAGGTDTSIVGSSGSPAYYATTDGAGYFNITGEYTCTAGLPVYLYAYGGAPDTNPSVGASNLSSGSLASNGTYLTETFTVDNEKFYVGQSVTFAGIPAGNEFASNNGQTFTVSAVSTTDNKSFTITTTNAYTGGAQGPFSMSGTVTPVGVQNPAIVNVAVLGNCPSSQSAATTITGIPVGTSSSQLTGVSASDISKLVVGEQILGPGVGPGGSPTTITAINTSAGTVTMAAADTGGNGVTSYTYTIYSNNFGSNSSQPISFIYMNEVSTAAAMFALAPFAETSTTSGGVVTRTGTDAQHIGIPASDSLALTGIQNAATNAGQLYDITGSNVSTGTGCSATTGQCPDGEAHIARSAVPNSGNGQGVATVPQSLIDTLGNILAACVDSANTYGLGATSGTASPACKKLFLTATNNGIPVTTLGSTTPTDIATAAINIAHYPAGNGASAGLFVSTLSGIPTGVVPFTPNLGTSTPTDFVIGINITVPQGTYPTSYLGSGTPTAKPTAIATDAYGDAYVGTTGCGNSSAESATNGHGCVLQILPTQLLPGLPTVSGVGFAQGVRAIALGPGGKLWATGVLETGQTVSGYTPPAGAYYIVVNVPSPTSPLVTGASSTTEAFAAFGNSSLGNGTYTNYFGNPTAIVVNGNARAYIADSTKNYLHIISSENVTPIYTITNTDVEYLIQGNSPLGGGNCLADVTALSLGSLTPATTANGSGAYNVWAASSAGGATQGMCVIADPNVTPLSEVETNSPTVNTVTPVAQLGLLSNPNTQYTPTSLAVDANDVGWDTNQSPSSTTNQKTEGFPNNGSTTFNSEYGIANNNTTTPTAIAIDGNNNLWVANLGSNSVSVYTNPGAPTSVNGTTATAISPAGSGAGNNTGGYTAGSTMSGPAAIAIDPSGDVWVTNTGTSGVGYSVTELIGVAAPTYSGLAAAAAANKLGAKP